MNEPIVQKAEHDGLPTCPLQCRWTGALCYTNACLMKYNCSIDKMVLDFLEFRRKQKYFDENGTNLTEQQIIFKYKP